MQSPPNITIKSEPSTTDNDTSFSIDNMELPPLLIPIKSEPPPPTDSSFHSENDNLLQNSSEEPIFHCNICDEMYSCEKELNKHKQIHTRCRVCLEKFSSDDVKNEHEKLHYSTKPGYYRCLVCKVSVKHRDHFNIHAGKLLQLFVIHCITSSFVCYLFDFLIHI